MVEFNIFWGGESPQPLNSIYGGQVWETNSEIPSIQSTYPDPIVAVRICYVLRYWQWCLCFIRWSLWKFTISRYQCSVYESWQCVISDESLSQYKERGCNTGILRALIRLTTAVGTLDLNSSLYMQNPANILIRTWEDSQSDHEFKHCPPHSIGWLWPTATSYKFRDCCRTEMCSLRVTTKYK